MALCRKKQQKLWIWLAYSRAKRRVIACEIGSRRAKTLRRLWARIKSSQFFAVCADKWKVYSKVIPYNFLIKNKKYSHNIEAQNSSLRDFIKRFNRKTKAYSKAKDMTEYSVYIYIFYNIIS